MIDTSSSIIDKQAIENLRLFVNSLLHDDGKESSNYNYYYYCPFCNHHKRKLSINLKTGNFQCWTCPPENNTRGSSLFHLLGKLKLLGSQEIKGRLTELLGELDPQLLTAKDQQDSLHSHQKNTPQLQLPSSFIPLFKELKDPYWIRAYNYLVGERGLTPSDITQYLIGYCETGQYSGRVIIPSYNSDGKLNYFTARDFLGSKDNQKYKNPPVSRDVIAFEYFIDWRYPVILVEGMFDAIKVQHNSIPLLGKRIEPVLQDYLLSPFTHSDIYIILDEDARKDLADITLDLKNSGKNVYWVDVPAGKDLGDLTHTQCRQLLLHKSHQSTMQDVIQNKLSKL